MSKIIIGKIVRGIGSPGKLWTGDQPQTGEVWELRWLLKTCPKTSKTTKVLRGRKIDQPVELLEQVFGKIPTVFITMGGVGSIKSSNVSSDEDTGPQDPLRGWNWSERIGGHAMINPIMVKSGYINREDIPTVTDGFYWLNTYEGDTLSEFVLLAKDERHNIPITECEVLSPPARNPVHKEPVENDPNDWG